MNALIEKAFAVRGQISSTNETAHPMPSHVRRALPQDAEAIAAVHVRTWQIAYRGQLPDHFLEKLTESTDRRIEFWRNEISAPPHGHEVWVAGHEMQVDGFAAIGPARDEDPKTTAELYAIYVEPKHWNQGLGRALFEHSTRRLAGQGYATAILWVLESNTRARRFYEIAGWAADSGSKIENRHDGIELREIRYRIDLRRENEES